MASKSRIIENMMDRVTNSMDMVLKSENADSEKCRKMAQKTRIYRKLHNIYMLEIAMQTIKEANDPLRKMEKNWHELGRLCKKSGRGRKPSQVSVSFLGGALPLPFHRGFVNFV